MCQVQIKTLILFDYFFLFDHDLCSYCEKSVLIFSVPYSFGSLIIQAGYKMVPFQKLLPNGSHWLFTKRKCTCRFNQCLQQDNWEAQDNVVYHGIYVSSNVNLTKSLLLLWTLFSHSFLISWLSTLYRH